METGRELSARRVELDCLRMKKVGLRLVMFTTATGYPVHMMMQARNMIGRVKYCFKHCTDDARHAGESKRRVLIGHVSWISNVLSLGYASLQFRLVHSSHSKSSLVSHSHSHFYSHSRSHISPLSRRDSCSTSASYLPRQGTSVSCPTRSFLRYLHFGPCSNNPASAPALRLHVELIASFVTGPTLHCATLSPFEQP